MQQPPLLQPKPNAIVFLHQEATLSFFGSKIFLYKRAFSNYHDPKNPSFVELEGKLAFIRASMPPIWAHILADHIKTTLKITQIKQNAPEYDDPLLAAPTIAIKPIVAHAQYQILDLSQSNATNKQLKEIYSLIQQRTDLTEITLPDNLPDDISAPFKQLKMRNKILQQNQRWYQKPLTTFSAVKTFFGLGLAYAWHHAFLANVLIMSAISTVVHNAKKSRLEESLKKNVCDPEAIEIGKMAAGTWDSWSRTFTPYRLRKCFTHYGDYQRGYLEAQVEKRSGLGLK